MIEPSMSASSELIAWVFSHFGMPAMAALPDVQPDSDNAGRFEHLLTRVVAAPVVLFPDISLNHLDGFFHLRLAQVLRGQPPLPAVSIIALSRGRLAGGFSDRFRSSWPFARCIFVTDRDDGEWLSAQLGLPVRQLSDPPAPAVLPCQAGPVQQIAFLFQPMWRRCGSTTGFENQTESLVKAGFLTIRLFMDGKLRRGPTLNKTLQQVIPENGTNAGAHINLVSVPPGPPPSIGAVEGSAKWAAWLVQEACCAIHDTAARQAARRAHSVIASHIERVGPALMLAPQARLLLDVPDDRASGARIWALLQGASEARAARAEAEAAWAQACVMAIPDLCAFVSVAEAQRLGPYCQRNVTVPPRVYSSRASLSRRPRWDILLSGDLHAFNVASVRWFLESVWLPYLAGASVTVAIAGRVGDRIGAANYASPLLHVMGFVEDLEAVRSQCRLTVVPDRAGTGISVKLLTALAQGHPVATTSVGLRGLDASIASRLAGYDEAAELADDIVKLINDPHHLEQRRISVTEAQQAIHHAMDYADWLAHIEPRPRAPARRVRRDGPSLSALPPRSISRRSTSTLTTPFRCRVVPGTGRS